MTNIQETLADRIEAELIKKAGKERVFTREDDLSSLYKEAENSVWKIIGIPVDYRGVYNAVGRITNPLLQAQFEEDFPRLEGAVGYTGRITLFAKQYENKEYLTFLRLGVSILKDSCGFHGYGSDFPTFINRFQDDLSVSEFVSRVSFVYSTMLDSLNMKKVENAFHNC